MARKGKRAVAATLKGKGKRVVATALKVKWMGHKLSSYRVELARRDRQVRKIKKTLKITSSYRLGVELARRFDQVRKRRREKARELALKGKGITIAVIDSGIAADHYEFKSKNVIRGQQFIEDWPITDEFGHGTHVASIAAGAICSIAPLARLRIYKIDVDEHTSRDDIIAAAMLDAINNNVDIISLSYSLPPEDFDKDGIAIGACRAAMKGILVVCAAGNWGPSLNSIRNGAPWCITVGASETGERFRGMIRLGNGSILKGDSIHTYPEYIRCDPSKDYPLKFFYSAEQLSMDHDSEGSIVVIRDDPQVFSAYQMHHRHRARGLIIINKDEVDSINAHATINISGEAGNTLIFYISHDPAPIARIMEYTDPKRLHKLAEFSSRGPGQAGRVNRGFDVVKPDVITDGVRILGAYHMDNERYIRKSGTSMAAPKVSACAAILKALHPSWTPDVITSALVTTTDHQTQGKPIRDYDGSLAEVFKMGSGEVNLHKAKNPGLVYANKPNDWIPKYLRGSMNYTEDRIQKMVGKDISIGEKEVLRACDLNYPSFRVEFGKNSKTFKCTRTLTNIGKVNSHYTVKSKAPKGVRISFSETEHNFESLGDTWEYTVTFKLSHDHLPHISSGSITWESPGMNPVRSPVGFLFKRDGRVSRKGSFKRD